MKKYVALVLALVLCLSATLCLADGIAKEDIKIGMICLHDVKTGYDYNFMECLKTAMEELGLEEGKNYIIKQNVAEGAECTETALDMIDEGCNIIFADSFGHGSYILEVAKEYPDVEFIHATGTFAHTEQLANYHDAFANIYQGRFLVGVAAGMKLNELKEAGKLKGEVPMIGYVGAFPYAEVISGFTSFYLGAKYVCPDVIMKVQYSGSWADEKEEKSAAEALLALGCDLISQHADTMGAPTACEDAGVPNVAYNLPTEGCDNTYLITSRIDWVPYIKYIVNQKVNGEAIAIDYCGTFDDGMVKITAANPQVAVEGTDEKLAELQVALQSGELQVFDTATFTVNGETLTEYLADVDDFGDYAPETQVISDGYFHESVYRSAPYFNLYIDGVEALNMN